MPFVRVKVLEGVLSAEQKEEIARRIPEVIAQAKGADAFASVVHVVFEEIADFWGVGGEIVRRPDVEKMVSESAGTTD